MFAPLFYSNIICFFPKMTRTVDLAKIEVYVISIPSIDFDFPNLNSILNLIFVLEGNKSGVE